MSHPTYLTGQFAAVEAHTEDHRVSGDATLHRLTRLATRLLSAPTALVTLVDADRQRFRASVGLREPYATQGETPLSHSFCQHVVRTGAPLIVVDARAHPVLCTNEAIGDLGVIGYLGVPLRERGGRVIGSFCVIDSVPRDWSADEQSLLDDLAQAVMSELDNERAYAAMSDATGSYRALLDTTTELVCAADGDGVITYVNQAWADAFGYGKRAAVGKRAVDLVAPEHRARFVDVARRLHAGEAVDAFEVVAIGADGRRVVCRGNATALVERDSSGMTTCIGTRAVYRDVTAERLAEAWRARLVATLERLDGALYEHLEHLGARLEQGLVAAAKKNAVDVCVQRVGSMITMFFTKGPVKTFADAVKSDAKRFGRWHGAMLSRGQYWPPSQYEAAFFGNTHDDAIIDATIAAADEALKASA